MMRALQDLLGRDGQINQKFGKDMMQQLMTISDVETLVAEAGAHLPLLDSFPAPVSYYNTQA